MNFLITVISFLWFVRTCKAVLFWIYLWQLKDYHVWRFIDHFRTYKGKKIFLNGLFVLKLVLLLVVFLWSPLSLAALYVLILVYLLETGSFLYTITRGQIKKPVMTLKTVFLTMVSFVAVVFFLLKVMDIKDDRSFMISMLLFDLCIPLIISCMVLLFQPLFVMRRNAILKKAAKKRDSFKNLIVIGITGSYGKTSTKEFLTTILSKKFNVVTTKDHQNSEMGIAQTILKDLNEKHQVFVVEMGAYRKGGIKLLCDITKPTIGMVTGVNEQHLALFGSLENLLSAEGGMELVDSLPKDGLIVLNGNNKYCLELYRNAMIKKKLYAEDRKKIVSDIWTEEILAETTHLSFIVQSQEKEILHFKVNVLGRHNIQNLLGAILVARELGMSLHEISLACNNITQKQGGTTLQKGSHGINIIDSSYSSNPDGVRADLDYLKVFPVKRIIVMPCLIELGKKSKEIHEQIGMKIAEVCHLAIITTKERFEDIKRGAVANGMSPENIVLLENPKEIFSKITTFCSSGDTVLLEGRVPSQVVALLRK